MKLTEHTQAHEYRITRLEEMLGLATPSGATTDPVGQTTTASGLIVKEFITESTTATSPPTTLERDAGFVAVSFVLRVSGSTTSTATIYKNGVSQTTVSLTSGLTGPSWSQVTTPVATAAEIDQWTVAVTFGTSALGANVKLRFR